MREQIIYTEFFKNGNADFFNTVLRIYTEKKFHLFPDIYIPNDCFFLHMQNYVLVVFQKRKVAVYKNFEGSVTFNYSNIDVYNIHTKFLPAFWMKAHK